MTEQKGAIDIYNLLSEVAAQNGDDPFAFLANMFVAGAVAAAKLQGGEPEGALEITNAFGRTVVILPKEGEKEESND